MVQANTEVLLSKWLNHFKINFGQYPEAQSTIAQVEEALKLYQEKVVAETSKVEMSRAIEDRSVLEYGLEYHLPRFVDGVRMGLLLFISSPISNLRYPPDLIIHSSFFTLSPLCIIDSQRYSRRCPETRHLPARTIQIEWPSHQMVG